MPTDNCLTHDGKTLLLYIRGYLAKGTTDHWFEAKHTDRIDAASLSHERER